jgi:hypothetical protein
MKHKHRINITRRNETSGYIIWGYYYSLFTHQNLPTHTLAVGSLHGILIPIKGIKSSTDSFHALT